MRGSTGRGAGRFALWGGKPNWVEPMQAVAAEPPADAAEWVWEPLLSGTRCLIWTRGGAVRIRDAAGATLDARHRELRQILSVGVRGDTILDGVITRDGLFLFDCLYYEGAHLGPLPLVERKAVLRDAVWFCESVRLTPCGTELPGTTGGGIVGKRLTSGYVPGASPDWLAIARMQAQEFVIGGYSELASPSGGLSLLIGYYENGRLRYAGRVSSASRRASIAAMLPTLTRLRRRTTPFGGAVPGGGNIQWISPALVARVGFAEWSPAGMPRRPHFIALCHDREPDEVQRIAAR